MKNAQLINQKEIARRSLMGARARIGRAEWHIHELRQRDSEFLAARSENTMCVSAPPGTSGIVEDVSHTDSVPAGASFEAPTAASIIVGETVQNLRTALDYLIYGASALNNCGFNKATTQWPIVSDKDKWKGEETRRLSALTDAQKEKVRERQPYFDKQKNHWAAQLQRLSNADKHQLLIVTIAQATRPMTLSRLRVDLTTRKQVVQIDSLDDLHESASPVAQKPRLTFWFEDGEPVVGTLEEIRAGVADAVNAFSSDLQ